MDRKWRLVIADDHRILREGLRALLSSNPDFEVVGEAQDGREAIRRVEEFEPDLVLMDLSMPRMGGIDAIREIRKRFPETRILVVTVHTSEEFVYAGLKEGANGYVSKDASHQELTSAISNLLAGKSYLGSAVSSKVIQGYVRGGGTPEPKSAWNTLTPREREILKMAGEGHRSKEIAEFLCISPKTVEKHRANIMKKLDLHSVSELTRYAIEKGIVTR